MNQSTFSEKIIPFIIVVILTEWIYVKPNIILIEDKTLIYVLNILAEYTGIIFHKLPMNIWVF